MELLLLISLTVIWLLQAYTALLLLQLSYLCSSFYGVIYISTFSSMPRPGGSLQQSSATSVCVALWGFWVLGAFCIVAHGLPVVGILHLTFFF